MDDIQSMATDCSNIFKEERIMCRQQQTLCAPYALTHNVPYRLVEGYGSGAPATDLNLALLRRVVRQARGGDVVALLILENLFDSRLPLLHFDL